MGQAFERKWSGKRAKRRVKDNLWHIDKEHETMVVNNNAYKGLKVKLIEEKNQVERKVQVQEEDQVKKDNVDKVIGSQSNVDVKSAHDNSKDFVENGKSLDLSSSSCSSEIKIFSESD